MCVIGEMMLGLVVFLDIDMEDINSKKYLSLNVLSIDTSDSYILFIEHFSIFNITISYNILISLAVITQANKSFKRSLNPSINIMCNMHTCVAVGF